MEIQEKYNLLKENIAALGKVAVAFSSGVDSTFLLKVCKDVLDDNVVAITARSSVFPSRESDESSVFCKENNIKQIILDVDQLKLDKFSDNPADRCYHCKKYLFTNMRDYCKENDIPFLVEGSNVDDEGDYRPGLRAIAELSIKSPLREARLTKEEIRFLSQKLNLHTWDKPSYACLASRIPYGDTITREKLGMIEQSEGLLLDMGFRNIRCRMHGNVARIELPPEDFDRFMEKNVRERVYDELTRIGFKYVSLDIKGFRSGSMNEVLAAEKS
ncbi:ATP-dependent sacrificial sulfur transferase LarE [Butyrivibrio sp. YAB3001]|uniref:ATP-dependent sacrificial sulfur transferase LarE n=1 Tax=Butyrivibrio sp. YAB3001 TaxID=1520812 RepID=UPI0008F62298|nr:ATP-dependent sacrificial sulfur transferase LarE [Butyrivibrio sp. YAB3001]SFC41113.1 uncharacterized protein SAMN02910398_02189 [Butyrivibrio sp. YAB3001]